MKRFLKIFGTILLFSSVAIIAALLAFNIHTISQSEEYIFDAEDFKDSQVDYVMVLGCSVRPGGEPSDMLYDRMITGIEIYNMGAAKKFLITGDSEDPSDYDETEVMNMMAEMAEIPEEDIMVDTVGLSTYDSIKRAKEQLEGKTVIIVTQGYHLYRAVYIARELGLDAYGCRADLRTYAGQTMRDIREWIGRSKDEIYLAFDFDSKYGTERPIEKYTVTDK